MNSHEVKRIEDVMSLRARQFAEDGECIILIFSGCWIKFVPKLLNNTLLLPFLQPGRCLIPFVPRHMS